MIKAVFAFGILTMLFEFVLISMVPAKWRLRMLGNPTASVVIHLSMLMLSLVLHWGTLTGTMAGILAFVLSIVTTSVAKLLFGYVTEGRYYHVGLLKYAAAEIR